MNPARIRRRCPACRVRGYVEVRPRTGVTTAWRARCSCGYEWPCRISAVDRLSPAPPDIAPDTSPEPTWTTRDGRVILVVDMGDQHLANTIAMLRRKNRGVAAYRVIRARHREALALCSYLGDDPPDGAAMAAEEELGELLSRPITDRERDDALGKVYPTFATLVAEARRRSMDGFAPTPRAGGVVQRERRRAIR